MGRVMCALFAPAFLFVSGLSFAALWNGVRQHYFEAGRFGPVYKVDQPISYWMYFGLHAALASLCFAVAIGCAALFYLNPFVK
jgi:hypothetical protein